MDFTLRCSSSIALLTPHTDAAQAWLDEHIGREAVFYGPSLLVDARYVDELLTHIARANLQIEKA